MQQLADLLKRRFKIRYLVVLIIISILPSCATEKGYKKTAAIKIAKGFQGLSFYPPVNMDTLNKFDSANYRVGYWIDCLDKNGYPTDKKEEKVFYRYSYYIMSGRDGVFTWNVYPYSIPPVRRDFFTDKLKPMCTMVVDRGTNVLKKDTLVEIDGKCLYYHRKRLLVEEDYKNGMLMDCKEFYRNGKISQEVDYTKKYKATYSLPHSCSIAGLQRSGMWLNE